MTECYSARCQQDRKLARREFNKWTKNVLLQIGLETISKNHLDFDVNHLLHPTDDESMPNDFNPDEKCLFCVNRQDFLGNKKNKTRMNEHHHSVIDTNIDDEENAPLDLSLKSTVNKAPVITSNQRNNLKQRPYYDIKSDIPPMYGQEEFDRFISEMIANQLDFSSPSFLNLNLFPTSPTIPIPPSHSNKKKNPPSSSQDARIAQLAKQMAHERMLEEIDYHRHPSATKKSKTSTNSSSSSILTESFHVNHILNDVMMRILQEMLEKQQQTSVVSQPRASRKGELLFVKKQNVNNDEQYNTNLFNQFINNNNNTTTKQPPALTKSQKKINPSSSSSSSTSSVSSTGSSSLHTKNKGKSNSNGNKGRAAEMLINNNTKIIVGTDGKQIRPKRGQYRRYESEQLAKAVAAVLSNEMSVHKAGSYFGVPHSTLEYKVKERNIKVSSVSKPKNDSTSINDGDMNIPSSEMNDDESLKGLGTYLPPSDGSTTHNHPNEINAENNSSDDEFDEQID